MRCFTDGMIWDYGDLNLTENAKDADHINLKDDRQEEFEENIARALVSMLKFVSK